MNPLPGAVASPNVRLHGSNISTNAMFEDLKHFLAISRSLKRRAIGGLNTEDQMSSESWRISFSFFFPSLRKANYLSQVLRFILFFSARRCSTVILPCPRIFPLYSIKRENRRLLNFHVITTLHKVHASTCLIAPHTRTFFFSFCFSCFDKLRTLPPQKTSLFYLWGGKKMHVGLFASALSLHFPLLSSFQCLLGVAVCSSAQEDTLVAQG